MERDQEQIRERVEAKRDEFGGGPEPGWQQMEETVQEVRSGPASSPAGTTDDASSGASSPAAAGVSTMTATAASPSDTVPSEGSSDSAGAAGPESEHPPGIGQQCFKCGAYNDLDAATCWQCHEKLTPTQKETATDAGAVSNEL